jgi:uncharacterized phage protein gp47/JayE
MAATQRELANLMLAQLRVLDPSISGEVGTPERKIIDTVAEAMADSQVDLTALQGALDLDSKFGDNLDRFLALFGFARQQATYAEGFVTFSRPTASTVDIRIPFNTQVSTDPVLSEDGSLQVTFATTFEGTIAAGGTSVTVPVRATIPGVLGNVAADTIHTFVGQPVFGVTTVTNVAATSGGNDLESDEEYKIRFRNTVFRNLAGTSDQFTALAAATAYTTKANVVGPVSRYHEYIQVPPVDDTQAYDVNSSLPTESGNPGGLSPAVAGEYTSALSTIPYSKYTYTEVPYFVSNGEIGSTSVFYRSLIDFRLNTTATAKNRGDAYRFFSAGLDIDPTSADATYRPNVTFLNVMPSTTTTDFDGITEGQIVLFEHSYVSKASRNDPIRNVHNAVDVFIDGGNVLTASTVVPTPGPSPTSVFVNDSTSAYHYDNYRRFGEPEHPPVLGNFFIPLFNEPALSLPDSITVVGTLVNTTQATTTYYKGIHYFLVEDVSELRGTIRARNGIEWNYFAGQAVSDPQDGPYTGAAITDYAELNPIEINDYEYDRNIIDLQASLEANKQVTTDVLAHRAHERYFKLDLTIMYTTGKSNSATDQAIHDAVAAFLDGQYFGTTIQLSDILQIVHNVSGVDNVRWSSDVPGNTDLNRVTECDVNGVPLLNVLVDRKVAGSATQQEYQRLIIAGGPTGGTFTLSYAGTATSALAYNIDAATLQTAINATGQSVTVSGSGTAASPFIIVWTAVGTRSLLNVDSVALTGGPTVIAADFFLHDDELPALPTGTTTGDTLPGLILRARAQNTWTRA